MAALGRVPSKVAPRSDDEGRVANWRPAEPCTSRSFAAAREVLPAAPVAWPGWRPPGASWSCEMNAGAASPWDFLRTGARVWWPSCCSAIRLPGRMLPRSIPGVLFHSGGLVGPPWVPKDVHSRVWVIGPHTHRGGGGVLHREGCRSASSTAFFVRFFGAYPPQ